MEQLPTGFKIARETIFKNNGVIDVVTDYDSNEYSGHAFTNTVNQKNGNEWILVTRTRNGKKKWTTY